MIADNRPAAFYVPRFGKRRKLVLARLLKGNADIEHADGAALPQQGMGGGNAGRPGTDDIDLFGIPIQKVTRWWSGY